eukprot:1603600-Prorocentrum_lima.AAC.1
MNGALSAGLAHSQPSQPHQAHCGIFRAFLHRNVWCVCVVQTLWVTFTEFQDVVVVVCRRVRSVGFVRVVFRCVRASVSRYWHRLRSAFARQRAISFV